MLRLVWKRKSPYGTEKKILQVDNLSANVECQLYAMLEQAAQRRPDAVRMLITGWTEEIPVARLQEVGIRAIVTKPWDDAKLKATLRQALGVAREPSPPKADSETPNQFSDYSLRR